MPPIPVGERQEKEALAADRGKPSRSCVPTLLRKKWVIASLVLAAIVAITIGGALGTTRISSATPFQTRYANCCAMSVKVGNNEISVPAPLEYGVLDDSSFAAVSAQDGSIYVFFQGLNGSLRQVYYSQTTLSWTSSTSQIIPSTMDARRNTPLAAVIAPSSNDEVKHLGLSYYI